MPIESREVSLQNAHRGASLIDTIVGIALMLLVFVGVAAGFQLSVEVVTNNKARTGAAALAQEQLEYMRSLSYASLGVSGGIPAGNIPQTEVVVLDGVTYTRRSLVRYFDDPKDGLGASDTNGITADSKEIKVEVSWNSKKGTRSVSLSSRASPPGIEQTVPGGTISISVENAVHASLSGATVRIQNPSTAPAIDVTSVTDIAGNTTFIGAPAASGYRISVSRSGYSSAQTYSADTQNPNPNPGHLTVANNQTTSLTLSIDLLGSMLIRSYKAIETLTWEDLFNDATKVATTTNATVTGGEARLSGPPYELSGEVQSISYGPSYLYRWREARWNDTKPASTTIRYQLYYIGGSGATPIPDSALAGNSAGFTTSPVDLTGVSTSTYNPIRLRALLTTEKTDVTPSIQSWSIVYDNGPEPLGNLAFSMHGNKTIGSSGSGQAIYKYDQALTTDALGGLSLPTMEEDTYTMSVNGASIGYDLSESCGIQPRVLAPAAALTTLLYFSPHTNNSLLTDVQTNAGVPLTDASVRLYRATAPSSDTTKTSSGCGQAFFSNLAAGTVGGGNPYSITVTASGYQPFSSSAVEVSGASRMSVVLNPL